MNTVIVRRKKPLYKRLRWDNIFALIFIILFISTAIMWYTSLDNFVIEHKEYYLQENDSLFNLVQDHNTFYPHGWDARDFVAIAKDINGISDVSQIRAGDKILIPIAKPKE